jgi:hypothetical protein
VVNNVLTTPALPEDEEVYICVTNVAAWCGTEANSYAMGILCNHLSVSYLTEEDAATPAEQSQMVINHLILQ